MLNLLIRRPIGVSFVAIALAVLGMAALAQLPVALLPPVTYPVMTVRVDQPGASALELEEQVLRPLEEVLGTVPGTVSLEGRATAGAVEVRLDLRADADVDAAASRLRERLGQVRLPPAAQPPRVLRFDPAAEPVLRLVLRQAPGGPDLATLHAATRDALVPQVEGLSEIAAVRLRGGRESELRVEPDPVRLAAVGLTPEKLEAALRGAVSSRSVGSVLRPEGQQRVRLRGSVDTGERVIQALVAPGVRLGDVARVTSVLEQPEELAVAVLAGGTEGAKGMKGAKGAKGNENASATDDRGALLIEVMAQADAGLVAASDAARARLAAVATPRPGEPGHWDFAGGRLVLLTDRAGSVRDAIADIRSHALIGALLAFAVILVFLRRLTPSLIVFLAIPLSVVITFLVMGQVGIGLNLMSLGGLALGLGRLVDDAIVVVESADRVVDEERPTDRAGVLAAVARGVGEVAPAVVASTLTTVAVFIPLAFLPGVMGALFFDQAFTVSTSLFASLAVALGLVPALLALRNPLPWARAIMRVLGRITAPAAAVAGWLLTAMESAYARALALVVRRPLLGLGLMAAALAIGVVGARALPVRLLPPSLATRFVLDVELPRGRRVEQSADWARDFLDRLAASDPGLEGIALAGESPDFAPGLDRRQDHEIEFVLTRAQVANDVVAEQRWLTGIERLALESGAVAAAAKAPPLVQIGGAGGGAISAAVRGPDAEVVREEALELCARLRAAGCRGVRTSATATTDEVVIAPDNAKLLEAGLTLDQVVAALSAAADIREIAGFTPRLPDGSASSHTLPIRIHGQLREAGMDALARLELRGATRPLPLSAVASITRAPGDGLIVRRDNQRVATVAAEAVPAGVGAQDLLARLVAEHPLPVGYDLVATGLETLTADGLRALALLLALSVFLVLVVMAVQFESLSQPLLVITAVPMAAAGAFPALALAGHGLDLMSGIGLVMLVGVAVANAIVLVSTVNLRRAQGLDPIAATLRAGRERLRPIVMTSATTVLGLAPLALGGTAAELRAPLAVAVIGGMVSSTLLVLLALPSVLVLTARKKS